jgi:hypothetical protein
MGGGSLVPPPSHMACERRGIEVHGLPTKDACALLGDLKKEDVYACCT